MPPRSRNFNGCWTCRARKIKCDAGRPTCLRCKKANLECKGYGLVLAWADVATIDGAGKLTTVGGGRPADSRREAGSSRRNVELVKFPQSMLYETYARLNDIVAKFDDTEISPIKTLSIGPFSVYPLRPTPNLAHRLLRLPSEPVESQARPASRNSHHDSSRKEGSEIASSAVSISDVLESDLESSIFSKTNNAYVHYELVDFSKLTILAIKGPRHKFSEQGMFHILYPKFFPNVDSDNWRPNGSILSTFFSSDDKGNIIIAPTMSSDFKFLVQSLSSRTRVSHGNNPWKRLVVPHIKQIFFEIICEEYPQTRSWKNHMIGKAMTNVPRDLLLRNMKFAIFCLCLSISWHERSLSGVKVKNSVDTFFVNDELKASIELRKIGINILNYHMDEYDANSDHTPADDYDTYFLMALTLQVHVDDLFGVFENYELIYAIGDFILKKQKSEREHTSSLVRLVRHNFNILNILYESTQAINFFNYSISELDQRSKYSDLNENYDLTESSHGQDQDATTDESEDESDSDDADDDRDVKLRAISSNSQTLSFNVSFNGDKRQKLSSDNNHKQIKASELRSLQRGRPPKVRLCNPVVPSLEDGSIYSGYGLPKSLLQLVQEVVHLTNHKNVFRTRGLAPRNFPRICAEIEDKILNFNIENHWQLHENKYNPITNVAKKTFISELHEGLYHNVSYFHNALVVYFKRLISESPIQARQTYIEKSFDHLENLNALNKNLTKTGKALSFNPSFWPLLVCGCDIDLKTHMRLKEQCQKLWTSDCFQRYNYWRSKQILYEVWYRRENDGEDNSFMDMIREWGIVLSLG